MPVKNFRNGNGQPFSGFNFFTEMGPLCTKRKTPDRSRVFNLMSLR
jgi:hypothetical protein